MQCLCELTNRSSPHDGWRQASFSARPSDRMHGTRPKQGPRGELTATPLLAKPASEAAARRRFTRASRCPRRAGRSSTATRCASRVKSGRALLMLARDYANEAARAAGVQTVDGWPWARKYSLPAPDTETTTPRSGARWRAMKPRSFASSHTGSRGHEVRHASSTSAYGRGLGPIHSRRSRIRLSTVSATAIYEHRPGERVL
jgi:hypothetical protein